MSFTSIATGCTVAGPPGRSMLRTR
jgi:hypothetical protein